MTMAEAICDDLRSAARFLMNDGHSLDAAEAVRLGISLAELTGMLRAEALRLEFPEPNPPLPR